jgi:hypothetical protein
MESIGAIKGLSPLQRQTATLHALGASAFPTQR